MKKTDIVNVCTKCGCTIVTEASGALVSIKLALVGPRKHRKIMPQCHECNERFRVAREIPLGGKVNEQRRLI